MRARVAGFTLAGSSKYFDSVGRDTPHAWAKSSIVRCVFSAIDPFDPFAAIADRNDPAITSHAAVARKRQCLTELIQSNFHGFQYSAKTLRASNYLLTL
jgi:hypothetical protein